VIFENRAKTAPPTYRPQKVPRTRRLQTVSAGGWWVGGGSAINQFILSFFGECAPVLKSLCAKMRVPVVSRGNGNQRSSNFFQKIPPPPPPETFSKEKQLHFENDLWICRIQSVISITTSRLKYSMARQKRKTGVAKKQEDAPELSPADSGSDEDSVVDSDVPDYEDHDEDDQSDGGSEEEGESDEEDDEFEDQGSSDEDDDLMEDQQRDADSDDEDIEKIDIEKTYEKMPRSWKAGKRDVAGKGKEADPKETAKWMHTDDLSSDDEDEDGTGNRIGKVPLHWYDEYDHIGYDAHGGKVVKTASAEGGDRVDQALAHAEDRAAGRFIVHDALNDKNVELSARQLELIRRISGGAYAHPEFQGNPDYIDYFSGVDPEISGINSNRYEPKSKFQPSKWEKMQVDKLLEKLEKGQINMDYLTGKVRDMNDLKKENRDKDKPYLLWTGAEEDELNMRKGPQHIAAPKLPPPGHAESYIPPDEYLPTEEDLKQWEDMEAKDRPHGHLIPKKFPNLRSVGAYEHSVRETFERCLDLYLCPRVMKRRLNIDPESLVPQLPKASDLRPFPTAKCVEYKTPYDEEDEPPVIRCISASPDGQFMASGASDGYVRLWEVQTGRLLRSWNVAHVASQAETEAGDSGDSEAVKPVVAIEWNPNKSHHCLLAAVGKSAIVIATGTEGSQDAEITEVLLSPAKNGGNVTNEKAAKSVKWVAISDHDKPVSSFGTISGPVVALCNKYEMAGLRWHAKGDYFVTVCPKAGAPAVLIHQLSKGNSQQPFSKAKGEAQTACFHPSKPFLFVATQQHVRVYHLVKQAMVKREYSDPVYHTSVWKTDTTLSIHIRFDFRMPMDLKHRRPSIWRPLNCRKFGSAHDLV
jgi:ribosome biogenesis protein ERB1